MSLQQAEEARLAVLPASGARPLWAAAAAVRAEGSFKCSACLSICQCGTAAHADWRAGRRRVRKAVLVAWQPALEQRQQMQELP